jgi:hypothetical protein
MEPQEGLRAEIARHVAALKKRYGQITACRVRRSSRSVRMLVSSAGVIVSPRIFGLRLRAKALPSALATHEDASVLQTNASGGNLGLAGVSI